MPTPIDALPDRTTIPPTPRCPAQAWADALRRPASCALPACASLSFALMTCPTPAEAQLVPPTAHAMRQLAQAPYTTVHLPWRQPTDGSGLQAKGRQLWPQWEGRIGVVIDRPVDPLKNNFVLAQPSPAGLQLRSLHILSDYHLDGGFRATAGVLRGHVEQAWWTGGAQSPGLNLSLQRLDLLRLPGDHQGRDRTMAYVGAGYSTSLDDKPGDTFHSHFNADIGLTATGQRDARRAGISATDGLGGTPLSGKLQWRPLIKVSVDYAF